MNGIVRIATSTRRTGSQRAAVKSTRHDTYPIEARLAGVTLALTPAAARRLAKQLETSSRKSP